MKAVRVLMLFATNRRLVIPLSTFIILFALGVGASFAQDLGDLARQERERQKNVSHPTKHVYTNEDLAKPQILAPEDRATFEANRQDPTQTPDGRSIITTIGPGNVDEIPLGDVARHYRMLRRLDEIQHADKTDLLPGRKRALASPSVSRPLFIVIPKPPKDLPLPSNQSKKPDFTTPAVENKIRVREGDSLWKLAKQHLGDGSAWTKLIAANPQLKNPNVIHAGEWIQLPSSKSSVTASPNRSQVRVKNGDSLWKLAQTTFGNGLAWSCIAEANPEIPNANLIYSGQVLTLPAHCTSARATALLQ